MNFSLALFAEDSNKNQESCFGNLDDEDRRLFDEAFIHKSIGEQDDLEEDLYHEQMLHSAGQEVWDDLLEENVLDDLDESNFPGAVETDPESFNRNILMNWLLLFICYWWTYCNIADRGIEMLLKFFHAKSSRNSINAKVSTGPRHQGYSIPTSI